ncbi:MAG: glycoside hydrolase TIM-barrel-like domain-containing protein [Candidatus Devosia euplotis]|nr:glycoside hydrolase TIM-barrel-like domain-containing protein [Candidatus Devosia euplotis]
MLDPKGLTLRFYRGTEDQFPDGLIAVTQGTAPAYRGLCYMVFELLPLSRFGNRIPQLSVELCRVVGDLESDIEAVTMIPGATEFGYDPTPRVRLAGTGATVGENTHIFSHLSDWNWSIDELTALCPNLKHVALVVAWFGDDLRCAHCAVTPRVEGAVRLMLDTEWSVAGLTRGDVPVVSSHNGGAAYGGAPSDSALLATIADLKARGIAVTLYPLILRDIPAGNGLPDPPWQERAGGLSLARADQLSPRARPIRLARPERGSGGADRRVRHALPPDGAALCRSGGGCRRRRYTDYRLGNGRAVDGAWCGQQLPFVDALVSLAAAVRAVTGPYTRLTYAADWREYAGYQPVGEKFFRLDPLWAGPAIDAVGIDNYLPLADWRDGAGHSDVGLSASGYNLDYLMSSIAGARALTGSMPARPTGSTRSAPPSRPADRVRALSPTAWVPGSKPIWFTEIGCGAVDNGANQPNIFGDEKAPRAAGRISPAACPTRWSGGSFCGPIRRSGAMARTARPAWSISNASSIGAGTHAPIPPFRR